MRLGSRTFRGSDLAIGAAVLIAAAALALRAWVARPLPAPSPTAVPTLPATRASTPSPAPSATPTLTPTSSPTRTPTQAPVGPEYLEGHNPLTGLPVSDLASLFRVPLLVSITEFPPSARPQSGLSAAAQVWETSIGEGMSRFLAVYYGDYLQTFSELMAARGDIDQQAAVLGPIRSGRVGYEQIRRFYPGALMITRYASPEVAEQLSNLVTIYADDPDDVNSAVLTLAELRALEVGQADPADYASLTFDPRVPEGGRFGPSLDVIYNLYDQIRWVYDRGSGSYRRWQDQADGTGTLYPLIDRLTGRQLQADNVLLMFARHKYENVQGTILEIELAFLPKRIGVLFRDGRMFDVTWSTTGLKLRLQDGDGEEIPLKPGTTYFQLLSFQSTWDEERRIARFHNPPLPTLTPTPTPTRSSTPTSEPPETEEPTATPAP
jgi:hypothetical protein